MPRLGMCSNNLKYNSRILNLLEHDFFTVYILIRASNVVRT